MTHLIRLFAANTKLVVGEVEMVRERSSAERVHYRKKVSEPCHLCNEEGSFVWVDEFHRWRRHSAKCNAVAFICKAKD